MYTEENILALRKDKDYKKTNRFFRNLKYTRQIIHGSSEGIISFNLSFSSSAGFAIDPKKAFWFVKRYYYITRELVRFRKYFLEAALQKNQPDERIMFTACFPPNSVWLDCGDNEKLKALNYICMRYIMDPENKAILARYATMDKSTALKRLSEEIPSQLDRHFFVAMQINTAREMREISYEGILRNSKSRALFSEMISRQLMGETLVDTEHMDRRG